jgi:hypothetical protein
VTTAKHVHIATRTILRWLPNYPEAGRLAEAIVSRYENAIEDELDQQGEGVVVDFPVTAEAPKTAPVALRQAPEPEPDTLPPPAPGQGSSVILATQMPTEKSVKELRLPPPGTKPSSLFTPDTAQKAERPKRYWSQDALRDFAYANFPPVIQVVPEGRKQPVSLNRNIEVLPGVDLVKVSYSLADRASPQASERNWEVVGDHLLVNENVPAMTVDSPIFDTLNCWDYEQDVDGKMQKLFASAEVAFRPKPEHIDSHTPRRVGALSFGERDPHDNADKLPNPLNGRVW